MYGLILVVYSGAMSSSMTGERDITVTFSITACREDIVVHWYMIAGT